MSLDIPTTPRFVLLAAIDASAGSDRVVSAAISFARMIPGAELHIVHALEDLSDAPAFVRGSIVPPPEQLRQGARKLLERHARSVAAEAPQLRVVTHLPSGTAWRRVVQLATDIQADLVMVGTHDYSAAERFVLGSVATSVVRKAPCPVLVVRAKEHPHDVPEIEPPCSQCLRVQRETRGATLWCARHGEHHPHARLHYEYPDSFAVGSTTLRT